MTRPFLLTRVADSNPHKLCQTPHKLCQTPNDSAFGVHSGKNSRRGILHWRELLTWLRLSRLNKTYCRKMMNCERHLSFFRGGRGQGYSLKCFLIPKFLLTFIKITRLILSVNNIIIGLVPVTALVACIMAFPLKTYIFI